MSPIEAPYQDELVAWRRDFHRHPELGFQEARTAGVVAERLRAFGLDVREGVAKTGVVGLLRGERPGPTVLLRADMDALPIQEANEVDYRSKNPGVMHACGHDGHTAMLLMLAKRFSERRAGFAGTLKFMFQPAEEGPGGAEPMIREGVLRDPPVDAAFAMHLFNEMPVGQVGVRSGPMLAAVDHLRITVRGKGGHGAAPHQTVDPILAASQIVAALQTVVSRSVSPLESAVVTIGQFHAGHAFNIIPEHAELIGTLRTFRAEVRETVLARVRALAEGVAAASAAAAEVEITPLYPATVNDAGLADLAAASAASVLGADRIVAPQPTMGGEDMAFVLREVPGCYLFIGSANSEKGLDFPHHNPRFDFDEAALPIGVEVMAATVEAYLAS
jgi:amidohydrolase